MDDDDDRCGAVCVCRPYASLSIDIQMWCFRLMSGALMCIGTAGMMAAAVRTILMIAV